MHKVIHIIHRFLTHKTYVLLKIEQLSTNQLFMLKKDSGIQDTTINDTDIQYRINNGKNKL